MQFKEKGVKRVFKAFSVEKTECVKMGVCVRVITVKKKGNLEIMKFPRAYRDFRALQVRISAKKVSGNFFDYEER